MEAAQFQARLEVRQWDPIPGSLQIREAPEGSNSPGILYGPVVVYGDVAKVYGIEEDIEAGAFGDPSKLDLRVNYMHIRAQPLGRSTGKNPGLTMETDEKRLYAELVLPNTQRARDTATEVDDGILQGFSVEFFPKDYRINERQQRITHTRSDLMGFGVVDIPAFKKSRPQLRWEDFFKPSPGRTKIWL